MYCFVASQYVLWRKTSRSYKRKKEHLQNEIKLTNDLLNEAKKKKTHLLTSSQH